MEIIPAILPKNFAEIEEKTEAVLGTVKLVQVDICDGKFVKSITWPYYKHDENFEAILKEERGMPFWEDLDYEFDLMIDNPTVDDARQWLSAGAVRIILHLESSPDLNPVLDVLQNLVEIGIAVNPKTKIEEIKKYAEKINFIQIMGIRKVGFQGQALDPGTFERVEQARTLFPNLKIQIDGGITIENAKFLKQAGAGSLAIGSAIFGNGEFEDIVQNIEEFRRI